MSFKTVAIDFDGVIHQYSKGWQDGTIYDPPVDGAIAAINSLLKEDYSVFIFSTRPPKQIKKWLRDKHSNLLMYMSQADFMDQFYPMTTADDNILLAEQNTNTKLQYKIKCVSVWEKFWNEKGILGVTNKKLPANVYIDDRGIQFNGSWNAMLQLIPSFKTYQNAT